MVVVGFERLIDSSSRRRLLRLHESLSCPPIECLAPTLVSLWGHIRERKDGDTVAHTLHHTCSPDQLSISVSTCALLAIKFCCRIAVKCQWLVWVVATRAVHTYFTGGLLHLEERCNLSSVLDNTDRLVQNIRTRKIPPPCRLKEDERYCHPQRERLHTS